MITSPAPDHLKFPLLQAIARAKNKTITIFDLETTTFVEQPTFGIAEIGALHIHPDGTITETEALINPENPMSPGAAEITGITDDMLKDKDPWGHKACGMLHEWALNHITTGFNCLSFDFKAVQKENKRYGQPDTIFADGKDVRSFWRLKSGSAKGKLTEIGALYGLSPEGAHRAIFDVRLTAMVLEKFLEEFGIDWFDHPGGAMTPNKPLEKMFLKVPKTTDNPTGLVSREDYLLGVIEKTGYSTLNRLSFQTGMSEFDLATMLGDLMHEGRLDAAVLADPEAQKFLQERVPVIIDAAWSGDGRGRLKPVMEAVRPYPKRVDYVQLRVFLKEHGYFAAIDKARVDGVLVLPNKPTPDDEPDYSTQLVEPQMSTMLPMESMEPTI